MKLLICTQMVDKNDPILGFFHTWIEAFSKDFSAVYVICLKEGVHTLPAHVQVFSLGKEQGENRMKYIVRFYRFFTEIFFRERVDFVFFHMGAIYNILAAPFFIVRKIFHTQFYWWKAHGHINFWGRVALLFVDRVYTSTESGFPIYTKKRNVVGQAVDASHFTIRDSSVPAATTKEIIFVGRITPIKRLEDFIETARILFAQDASYSFSIIGPIDDRTYYERLQELCRTSGLADRIQFLGPKIGDELVQIYTRAYLFLNTSQTQSMDKTVLEAMLCGCIPLTGNRAFEALLLQHNLYIASPNPTTYAARIQALGGDDLQILKQTLREQVKESHSIETFSKRIFNV